MNEMKECIACNQTVHIGLVKCWNCGGREFSDGIQMVDKDTLDGDSQSQLVKDYQGLGSGRKNSDSPLSVDEKILSALNILIEEQKQTRLAIRWGFGVIGFTLLLAFYVMGVKVNLSPTTITPYP